MSVPPSARRVASRWLQAKRALVPALKSALSSLQSGDVVEPIKALSDLWAQLGVSETPGDFTTRLRIEAEWFYGLGPRDKKRFNDLLTMVRQAQKHLGYLKATSKAPDSGDFRAFEAIVGEAAWLERVMRSDAEDGFQHGDFTVIPMAGVAGKGLSDSLATLDDAAKLLRSKFPQVLYGKVYVNKSVGRGGSNVALYIHEQDTISLSIKAKETFGDIHAIAHELGHRFEKRFWTDTDQREAFRDLSTKPLYETIDFNKASRAKLADEFVAIARGMRNNVRKTQSPLLTEWLDKRMSEALPALKATIQQYVTEKDDAAEAKLWAIVALPDGPPVISVQTKKVIREPLAVTPYGATKWTENFAEAFAFYVMGKPLAPEIAAIMGSLR